MNKPKPRFSASDLRNQIENFDYEIRSKLHVDARMKNGITSPVPLFLLLSIAICVATAAIVLYGRLSDTQLESIILKPVTEAIRGDARPRQEPLENENAETAPARPEDYIPPPSKPTEQKALSPESLAAGLAATKTVAAFYSDYLRFLAPFAGQDSARPARILRDQNLESRLVDFLYDRPDVYRGFAEKIDRHIAGIMQDHQMDRLTVDPVLMAQEIPTEIRYAEPIVDGDKASLIAYTIWEGRERAPVCVSLLKGDPGWIIEDISDMRPPHGQRECGGKTAEDSPPAAAPPQPEAAGRTSLSAPEPAKPSRPVSRSQSRTLSSPPANVSAPEPREAGSRSPGAGAVPPPRRSPAVNVQTAPQTAPPSPARPPSRSAP